MSDTPGVCIHEEAGWQPTRDFTLLPAETD